MQDDPLALLTFLDRLIQVEQKIEEEDKVREALMDVSPKIAKAVANVGRFLTLSESLNSRAISFCACAKVGAKK